MIRRSRSTRIAVTISVILHVITFIILAGVKLYTNEDVEEAEVSVTFVQELKTKVMRRSPYVRPAASLSESARRRPEGQQVAARPISSDFYIADTSEEIFSQVGALVHEVSQGTGIRGPSVVLRQSLVRQTTFGLRESNPAPPQMPIGGAIHKLFADDLSALTKPEMRIAAKDNDVLKGFLGIVRSKIETKKKYPVSARNAGVQGRSGIRMTILKNGQLGQVEIVDPSGHEILDNAALRSVYDASPFPPIPEEVGRDKIGMRIYLVFKIT